MSHIVNYLFVHMQSFGRSGPLYGVGASFPESRLVLHHSPPIITFQSPVTHRLGVGLSYL
jgi:hypothetical protein